jgi:hypothetical protein
MVALTACLPDVSTELSEIEARAILEDEVIDICSSTHSSEGLNRILVSVDEARIKATRDFWVFELTPSVVTGELEAMVFPSNIVAGSYVRYLKTRICK